MKRFAIICDDYEDGHIVVDQADSRKEADEKAIRHAKTKPDEDGAVYVVEVLGEVHLEPTIRPLAQGGK